VTGHRCTFAVQIRYCAIGSPINQRPPKDTDDYHHPNAESCAQYEASAFEMPGRLLVVGDLVTGSLQ
jgi:hypothetical protein